MMHENMRYNKLTIHGKFEKGAVFKLDAYIRKHDKRYGKISSLKILSEGQLELLTLLHALIQAIEKEEIDKQQGNILELPEYLKFLPCSFCVIFTSL